MFLNRFGRVVKCGGKDVHVYVILLTGPAIVVSCEKEKKKRNARRHACVMKSVRRGYKHKDGSLVPATPATINTVASYCMLKDIQRYRYIYTNKMYI